MRPKLLILPIFILSTCAACRKDLVHWQQVQKLETHTTTDRLHKILFINDSTGFIVGGDRFSKSTILSTTDGGQTWAYRNIDEAGKALFSIAQTPSGSLFAIGFDGKLLRSDNGGKDWKYYQIWYAPYKDLAFTNNNRGIIIGGISFNSGIMTFVDSLGIPSTLNDPAYEMNDIEMVDGRTGYVSGYGIVLKTADSGNTWQVLDIKNDNFKAIRAYGPSEAWTCGYNGSIYHTDDGGQSWQLMRNGNDMTKPAYRLLDMLFTDPLHGYAVGEEGILIYSDDGGHHWMELDRFTDAHLRCIISRRDGSLMVCGDNGSLYRVIPKHL